MDWMTFITVMTKALVWPGVVALILLMFRAQMAHLFERLGRRKVTAKGGGVEVTISEELDRVEEKVETLTPLAPPSDRSTALQAQLSAQSRMTADLTVDPSLPPAYIISQSWLRVVDALKLAQAAKSTRIANQPNPAPVTGAAALRFALEEEILTSDEVAELHELRRIRNISVHEASKDISLTDALRYSDLANRIVAAILMRVPEANTYQEPS